MAIAITVSAPSFFISSKGLSIPKSSLSSALSSSSAASSAAPTEAQTLGTGAANHGTSKALLLGGLVAATTARVSRRRKQRHQRRLRCSLRAANPSFLGEVSPESSLILSSLLEGASGKPVEVVATLAAAIVCHEAGHFFCARSVGLPAKEFALGFGPELINFGKDSGGTEFVIRLLPIGGYVRFNEEKHIQLEDGRKVNEFDSIPAAARLWVLSGGVLANIAAAWTSLFAGSLSGGIPKKETLPGIRVEAVVGEALERTGLRSKDILLKIGSLDLHDASTVDVPKTVDYIHGLPARSPVELLVERAGQQVQLEMLPITDSETGLSRLGVTINYNVETTIVKATEFQEAASVATDVLGRLFNEQFKALSALGGVLSGAGGSAEVVGPVGMVRQGEELAADQGLLGLALFFVSVNLNLALVNALPIPALDGGKAAFVLLEQASGKPLDEGKKQDVETIFVLLVLASLASLTAKDIFKIFKGD